jgi:hypothetical protein
MRTRIKTRVVVSDAITEMELRTNKRREWFNSIIVPLAHKYMEQGSDWTQAKLFALKEWQIKTSLYNTYHYGTDCN